jgi:2-keto-4-pentenoate hydratase/2-oxohepta-3-ene-1,7-dioic acid hydratase in catechol pathway
MGVRSEPAGLKGGSVKLVTLNANGTESVHIHTDSGNLPLERVPGHSPGRHPLDMLSLIQSGQLPELQRWCRSREGIDAVQNADLKVVGDDPLPFAPLYRHPPKIWGIGLNYAAHAADLSEKTPTGIPGSFMKPDTTVIGPGEAICIPRLSERTTAEAELGVVIGKTCRDVSPENWLDVVAGFTCVIDMTAEDILRQNPRYLTVAKSFDTFFSFGPELVASDEVDDVSALRVATVINGRVHAENRVASMTFSPAFLVSFLSKVMTLLPGDVISTGTPGAAVIADGDVVECRIDGFAPLVNPVKDLKAASG